MESISLQCPVTIKVKVTEKFRAKMLDKMEVDKAKGLKLKAKIEQDIADMKHLGLGAEIIQGTMQHVFNVKVGDKMPAVMNTEIIVEDEKIIEIRN